MVADLRSEEPLFPTLEGVTSAGQLQGLVLGDLSDFFNPFLLQFMEGSLRSDAEVTVVRHPPEVIGVSLYHPAVRLVSIFTRSPSVAASLLEGRADVDVFSELSLAPGAETYHIYAAELPTGPAHHRFTHAVREVQPSDRPALLALFRELYGRADEAWFRPIPPLPEKGFAVEVDGRLAGAAWVSVAAEHARWHSLSVRARYRRLGIGRDLWYARALWAREQGARTAIAEISEHSLASQAVATSAGMRRVGEMYRLHRP